MMKLQLQKAQDRYKTSADLLCKESPPFQIGNKIWLLRRNIKTTRSCDKLDYRRLGPFPISKQVNTVAYGLELLATIKIHPVFYISLLEPYKKSNFSRRSQPPPPFIEVDHDEEYEVEKVLDSRRKHGKLEYLVHWRGYDINERMWEPATKLVNLPQKVHEFHQLYPTKPGPI